MPQFMLEDWTRKSRRLFCGNFFSKQGQLVSWSAFTAHVHCIIWLAALAVNKYMYSILDRMLVDQKVAITISWYPFYTLGGKRINFRLGSELWSSCNCYMSIKRTHKKQHWFCVYFQWMSTCPKIASPSCIKVMGSLNFLVKRMLIMPSKWWTW